MKLNVQNVVTRRIVWRIIVISLSLFFSACNQGAGIEQAAVQGGDIPSPTLTWAATILPAPPAVISIATEPPVPPTLSGQVVPPTITPIASATNDIATPFPTATPFASITPTIGPTFTVPPLPQASPLEHYWLLRPIADGGIVWTNKTYPFGSTRGGTLRPHHGVEFDVTYNTEILASAAGEVVVAGADDVVAYGPTTNFYGNLVAIKIDGLLNGQPVYTLAGHLNEVYVAVGQRVRAGDVIGLSGATGVADGPHLHFEVRVGENSYGSVRNPLLWLFPFTGRGSVAGRVVFPSGIEVLEAPISLRRLDGPSRYIATTSYADPAIKSDPNWNENFVLDDVEVGYYELTVASATQKYRREFWVYEARTTYVEIVLDREPQ